MKILVAGIGNIFLGDDGFGCEVAQRLAKCELPEDIDVVDFGIRGLDLSYALEDDYGLAILIDTVQRGGAPGTVYVIEPEIKPSADYAPEISPHAMDPNRVLQLLAALGGRCPRVLLVACEPQTLGGEQGYLGLSDPVTAALDRAVEQVQELLGQLAPRQAPGNINRVANQTGARAPGG